MAFAELVKLTRQSRSDLYYSRVTDWFLRLSGADFAGLLLLDGDDTARFVADTGLSATYRNAVEGHFPWRPDQLDAKAFCVPDVQTDEALAGYRELFKSEGIGALSFIPIRGRHRLLGKLMGYYARPQDIDSEELDRTQNFAEYIAFVLDSRHAEAAAKRDTALRDVLTACRGAVSKESMAQALIDILLQHPGLGPGCVGGLYSWDPKLENLTLLSQRAFSSNLIVENTLEAPCACIDIMKSGVPSLSCAVDDTCHGWLGDADGRGQFAFPLLHEGQHQGLLCLFPTCGTQLGAADQQSLSTIAVTVAWAFHLRRVQRLLDSQEASFRALLDHAPITAAIHRQGRFVYVNHSMASSLGYDSAVELQKVSLGEVVHPDDRGLVLSRNREILASGKAASPRTERFLHKDGSTVFADAVAVPVTFGGLPTIFVLARDITEERALQAQSTQKNRLASLGQLAAMVGHDISNPLTYVTANVQFALSALGSDAHDTREALEDAAHGAELIGQITDDLRSYARVSDEAETVCLRDVIAFVTRMTSASVRDKAQLIVDIEPGISIFAVPARVTQVVMNIVSNAVQACAGTGRSAVVRIRGYKREGMACIDVQDTGVGMSTRAIGLAFEPFRTGKSEGTGLGLYITKNLVAVMGGSIKLASVEGEGTTVHLTLPLALVSADEIPQDTTSFSERGARAKSRLLLIDDELPALRGMERQLGARYDVQSIHGGAEALRILREGALVADVILCDIMMPDVSGSDLYQALEAAGHSDLIERFCFMTGGVYSEDALAFLEDVQVPVLFKPLDLEELDQITAKIVGAQKGVLDLNVASEPSRH